MKCPLCRGGLGRRCMRGDAHAQLSEGRRGADDESPRSHFASDGEEDYVVAGSRDSGHERPADAALALAISGAWLWRIVGPPGGQAQSQAGAAGGGRAGAGAVPGEVFRFERASFSREAATEASDSTELHVGEESIAGSGVGTSGAPARGASETAGTAAFAGDAAARGWQPAPVVSGPPLVRLAGDFRRCHQPGRGRIDDDGVAGAAGSAPATRDFLRAVQRPRQSLLLHATGWRESGCGTPDASGTSTAGTKHTDDPGVFAAGTRAIGTRVWNLARAAAAGVAAAR